DVKMNYLASPPLVVIYALAGTMDIDLATEPVAVTDGGKEVFLTDLWPSAAEIAEIVNSSISAQMYTERYADVFDGGGRWKSLETPEG
ncbi:hypothetical protein NPS74_22540, partial [Cutibacterium acnes subsp. acnes]|nr:hypothetical protein [Cutibacterium acnes subsp. acnes]